MKTLFQLILIITTFFKMSSGCETDTFGNPKMLDKEEENPTRLESDCWYSVASSSINHIPAVIERPSDDKKLVVYWEGLEKTSQYTILFDWGGVPYYNPYNHIYRYNFFISNLDEEGKKVFPISHRVQPNGYIYDVYHCAQYTFGCNTLQSEPHLGDLYLKFIATNANEIDVGRFKLSWEKQNSYIQPEQLTALKNLWTSCCLPTFSPPFVTNINDLETELDYNNFFNKNHCDWVLSINMTDTNLDQVTTNSCEEIENINCDDDGNVVELYASNQGLKCDNFFDYVKFPKLETLMVGKNKLNGDIKDLAVNTLTSLSLTDNYFFGKIPCFSKDMKILDLSMNKFSGVIPSCMKNSLELNVLDLSHNNFDKQVFPMFISSLKNLEILKLRSSNLQGVITDNFEFPSLEVLDISSNYLSGEIPKTLVDSENLRHVDMSFNFFTGTIPKLGKMVTHALYGMNSLAGNLLELLVYSPFNAMIDISHNSFYGMLNDEVVKQLLTKNLVVNMKGNNFHCDQETGTWSKSILYMNHILNLGKCSIASSSSGSDPSVITPPFVECTKKVYTYDVKFYVAIIVIMILLLVFLGIVVRFWVDCKNGLDVNPETEGSEGVEMIRLEEDESKI